MTGYLFKTRFRNLLLGCELNLLKIYLRRVKRQLEAVEITLDSYAGRQRATMKEKNDNLSEFDVKGETPRDSAEKPPDEDKKGLLSKISGGVYNKAASVVGGVGWVAGTAFSTTYTAVSAVSGVALIPFRKSPKDKSD